MCDIIKCAIVSEIGATSDSRLCACDGSLSVSDGSFLTVENSLLAIGDRQAVRKKLVQRS